LWAARELARLERESEKQERRRKFLKEEIKDSLLVTQQIDKEITALRNALRGM
jgi:predicted  nucleic acid-binding Zn-ribbon protein